MMDDRRSILYRELVARQNSSLNPPWQDGEKKTFSVIFIITLIGFFVSFLSVGNKKI